MYHYLKTIAKRILSEKILFAFEPAIRKLISLFYYGNKVSCPVCQQSFWQFIKIEKDDTLCPLCGSISRKRLLWLYLNNECGIMTNKLKILHFSPNRYYSRLLKTMPHLDYVTSDLTSKTTDHQYDITIIPEKDDSFDIVICYHVLEHVLDDLKAMAELYRIIRKGGRLITQVPFSKGETLEDHSITSDEERTNLFGQHDHVRYYGIEDFVGRLQTVGFRVEQNYYVHQLPEEQQKKYQLRKEEIIFVCTKKIL